MNICYVCNEYPPYSRAGGIGTYIRMMAETMVGAGHGVSVVGLGPSALMTLDKGVRLRIPRQWKIPRVGWYFNRRRLYRLLERLARAEAADIVEIPDSRVCCLSKSHLRRWWCAFI